jgi:CheY-like chemotaxis protein
MKIMEPKIPGEPMKKTAGPRQGVVLLIVEDDHAMRSLLCDELWDLGYRIIEAADGDEALERIEKSSPDLILTDLRMVAGGLDYVMRLRTMAPACPIILMTAFGDPRTRSEALRAGVSVYFDKPVHISDVKAAIKKLLDEKGLTSSSIDA